jgi:hypothetical protein
MKTKSYKTHEISWNEIRKLLFRKLRLKQGEQDEKVLNEIQCAYVDLRQAVHSAVQSKKTIAALSHDLQVVYRQLVEIAREATENWPENVKKTITEILALTPTVDIDQAEVINLIDRFTWPSGQAPPTLQIVDARRFRDMVSRETSRYGMNQETLFAILESSLRHAVALANLGILNQARIAREKLGIALDEYFITSSNQRSQAHSEPKRNSSGSERAPVAVFHEIEGLTFQEIKIRVDTDNLVLRLSVKHRPELKTITKAFQELGLTFNNGVNLNAQGKLFIKMARGEYSPKNQKAYKSALGRLSELLRQTFGTHDSPFLKGIPQFQISIPKDKAAANAGRRRSVSYRDDQLATNLESQGWLEENDPKHDPSNQTYSDDDF